MRYPQVTDPLSGEMFGIEECLSCGLGSTIPPPRDLGRYYGAEYYGKRHGPTAWWCTRRRLAMLRRAMQGRRGRLLDVGCGEGTFLLAAKRAGWQVAGTEIHVVPARAAGLEVWESLGDAQGSFDCVTMWHSLEHMASPADALAAARERMLPGGVLLAAVPDARGWQARLFRDKWFHLDVPRHLHHFSMPALERIVGRAGFTVERQWRVEFEYDVFGWVQSALNALGPGRNLLFRRLSGQRVEVPVTHYLLGGLLVAGAMPVTWLSAAARAGGTLVVAARVRS